MKKIIDFLTETVVDAVDFMLFVLVTLLRLGFIILAIAGLVYGLEWILKFFN